MQPLLPPEHSAERTREPSEFPSMRNHEIDEGVILLLRSPAVRAGLKQLEEVAQSKRALTDVEIEPVPEVSTPSVRADSELATLPDRASIEARLEAIYDQEAA